MASILSEKQRTYLQELDMLTKNDKKINELFNEIPNMSKDVYTKTTTFYAEAKYEEAIRYGDGIPHGFTQKLEDSIAMAGVSETIEKYKDKLELICLIMKKDMSEIVDLFNIIKSNNSFLNSDKQNAVVTLRSMIKKFNVKFKGEFFKRIIEEKNRLLNSTIIKITEDEDVTVFDSEVFLLSIFSNDFIKKRVFSMIYELLSEKIDDNEYDEIVLANIDKNCLEKMIDIIGLDKPKKYVSAKMRKTSRRLKLNYETLLNNMTCGLEEEQKVKLLNAILNKAESSNGKNNADLDDIKVLLEHSSICTIEDISVLLKKSNSILKLENGLFTFEDKIDLSQKELEDCITYENSMDNLKNVELAIKSYYNNQKSIYASFMKKTDEQLKASDADIIDIDKWLNLNKMKSLLPLIDINKLYSLSYDAFMNLKAFLIDGGLLWAYMAGNIDNVNVAKIINGFNYIYNNFSNLISIDTLFELIRKLGLYEYSNELNIGLIGLDTLEKIINYNQFAGVTVTHEMISQRVRKIADLAVRSEKITTSSLPFNCSIKSGQYNLVRYANNDPSILTSGIDTKTCFFVSANENDFFFYSLISKDGCVIKVLDNDKFIARATCFRRNNVFMINGIRYLNNKNVVENKEQLQQFKDIVRLIKLMAKKMIELTTNDECPIDYVVCNKAGILEESSFADEFEIINASLFSEPINIYSDDWERFIHTYDNENEQLFQEVHINPKHSFTTDFGDYYPACLIESRNNMGLFSPRDISYSDQEATYNRPRLIPEEYINEEIDNTILFRINRLRALYCFTEEKEKQIAKQANYHLISNPDTIKKVVLGDDWCFITYIDGTKEFVVSKEGNQARKAMLEMAKFLNVEDTRDYPNNLALSLK